MISVCIGISCFMKTEESLLLNQLENLFELTSANVYSKDNNGCYLGSNQAMLSVNNIQSEQEIIGATDYDLTWKEQASALMKNDQEVIQTNKAKTYIEPVYLNGKILHCYLSHKAPLRTSLGKVIGVFGLSFLLEDENSLITTLNEMSPFANSGLSKQIQQAGTQLFVRGNHLTKRQIDCLYYLVKGMTIKKIANTLNLSPKTVEHYLDAVKVKLNCRNRTELIATALQMPAIREKL